MRRSTSAPLVDQWSRWNPILEAAPGMSGSSVAEALDRYIAEHGALVSITVDLGMAFTSRALDDWAYRRGVKLDFIRSGKPSENGLIESLNGKLREECLNDRQFPSMDDARIKIERWWNDYNPRRPHGSLGHLPPASSFNDARKPD